MGSGPVFAYFLLWTSKGRTQCAPCVTAYPENTHRRRYMRPSEALSLHRSQIREIALRHRVSSVRVFGSALHGDDTADSDLDLLVEPTAQTTLMNIGTIRFELKQLLGMEVDVLTPNSLPASFREQMLREAMAV